MKNKKIAIYSRKSKFTGKGESIENQIELCKSYIRNKQPDICEDDMVVYEDEGYSGKNTNRPQFQQMMKDAKEKKLSGIVCYRLDRISRNVGDFTLLIDELNDYGISFDSINEKFDTSTPMGKAMMYICSIFAQLERETIAERIRDNMRELAKTGRWLGGVTPTGYKSEKIVERINFDGKEMSAYKLDIIPEESKIVQLLFRKFAEFNSLSKVETYFLQHNIKTKNKKPFTRFAIKAILMNPVYMIADEASWDYFNNLGVEIFASKEAFDGKNGLMVYNKTLQRSGKTNIIREAEEWIVAVGKHTGLISGKEWILVQELLSQNTVKAYRKPRSHTALLSGLIVCGHCGSYMRPKMYSQEYEPGERRFSYLCEMKEKSQQKHCRMKNPNGNVLDRMVCSEIKRLSEDNSEFIRQLESAKKKIRTTHGEFDLQIETLKNGISEKKQQIGNLVSNLAQTGTSFSNQYIHQKIEELDRELSEEKRRLEELEGLTEEHFLSEEEFDILKEILCSFANTFDKMGIEQKRAAIRTFVKQVVWDGENIHLYLMGSEEKYEFSHSSDECSEEPSGEDSKRNFNGDACGEKTGQRSILGRTHWKGCRGQRNFSHRYFSK